MELTHEQILTLQSLEGCGIATINKVASAARKNQSEINDIRDLYEFLEACITRKEVTRFRLPSFHELTDANSAALRIIELSINSGISMISLFDNNFPLALRNTIDEKGKQSNPVLLYYKGNLSITSNKCIAIIGTREPTKEGIQAGEFFGAELARLGANIVSGLALGCDSAGHRGALKASGLTTAFLANGLDTVYPSENKKLAEDIVSSGGLLMSEYPIGTVANQYGLVARDRLQAALSLATIVIQTGVTGGTMHAVNATLQSMKPLFAVKYDPRVKDKVDGNDYLINSKGAIPLTSSSDLSALLMQKDDKRNSIINENVNQGLLFTDDDK